MQRTATILLVTLLIGATTVAQKPWILVQDTATGKYGYRNGAGKMVIPFGKYADCITDTFRGYAIVMYSGLAFVGIDRQEHILYHVLVIDNGPDYPSDGFFRIVKDGKIGYAYTSTGKIAIQPQFPCAWPFEHGVAKVALDCQEQGMGEYHAWDSNHWFFINKAGVKVNLSTKKSAAYEQALEQFGHSE